MDDTPAPGPTRPHRHPDAAWVVVDGEAVVYQPEREELHHLDASATAIWERLDGIDVATLTARLAAEAGLPAGARGEEIVAEGLRLLRETALLVPDSAQRIRVSRDQPQ